MAYERLDIEVTDNGSSRRVQRSLEDLGRTGKESVGGIVQEMARAAVSGGRSGEAMSAVLQDLQRQFATTARASLLAGTAMGTVTQAAIAASRPVSVLGASLLIYSGNAATSSRASLLAGTAMGTVMTGAIAALRPVAALAIAMDVQAAAAVRMTQANLLAGTAMRTIATQQIAAQRPAQLLLPNYAPSGPAGGSAAAAAGANNFASILQRIQGLAGSTRNTLSSMWTSIRSGATSAAQAVGGIFSGFSGGGGGGGGANGAAAAAGGASRGIAGIGSAAKQASSALITMNTLMYSLQLGMILVAAVKWADEWQSIQNKLAIVTKSTENLIVVNDALFQSAQKTRTAYADMVELFQGLTLQAANLGLSQKAVADLATTVSQASQIGSLSQASAKAGVQQFIQSLALGRLSGQNLNSVLQQTPRIAIAIAEGLGVTTSQLRSLAEGGKLTANQIVTALQSQAPKIAAEFTKISPTISSAFTVLNNAAIEFMGKLEQSTGFASGFANMILALAGNMDILAAAVVVVGAALLVAFGGAVQRAIIATSIAIAANPLGAFIALVGATIAVIVLLKDRFEEYPGLLALFAGGVAVVAVALAGPLVASLIAATSAAWAFAVAILANPLTWIALAIGAAVAAIVYFGNKTYEVNGKVISGWSYLRAAAAGTWAAIVAGAFALWNNLSNIFTHIVQALGSLGMAFMAVMRGDFAGAAKWGKMAWSGASAAVSDFQGVGAAMGNAYSTAFNASVAAAPVATPKGAKPKGALDTIPGIPSPPPSEKDKKGRSGADGEGERRLSRAELILAEMTRLTDETKTAQNIAYTYLDRAAYEAIDKFNAGLRKKKDENGNPFQVLSPGEEAAMLSAILGLDKAKRLQEARDSVLKDAIGPRLKYIETEEAIGQLLRTNQISADEAAKAYLEASIAFYSTKEDAVSGQMLGRLKIMKEMRDQATPIASAMKSIWEDQTGPMRTYAAALQAITALEKDRLITAQQAANASRDATITYLDSQTDAASGVTRALMKISREAQDVATQMETIFTNAFKNLEDAWVGLTKTGKFDVKGLFDGLQEDIARATFKQYIGGPLANFAQSKLGIDLPGLKGPVGESRSNPMWVRSADGGLGLPGADGVTGGAGGLLGGGSDPISSILGMFGLGKKKTGAGGGTFGGGPNPDGSISLSQSSVDGLNEDLKTTFDDGSKAFGNELGAGVGALGSILGGLIGGEAGSIISTLAQGFSMIAPALGLGFATGGSFVVGNESMGNFATGGGFTVGGGGGVDSQLVQFRASPGERVSIDRAGQASQESGGGGMSLSFSIDARGADANVEMKIRKALEEAAPKIVTAARVASNQDRQYEATRMPVGKRRN